MGTLVAERIDRPLSLFDAIEAPAPARPPEREVPKRPDEPGEGRSGGEQGEVAAPEGVTRGAAHVHDGVGGEPTLDEMIVAAWEGLAAQAAVACPLCDGGTLRPLYADAGGMSPPTAGRCDSCGTTIT